MNNLLVIDSKQGVGANINYDSDAILYFNACSDAGFPVTNEYKIRYNNYILKLKELGKWSISDCRYVWATGNKNWAKIDIKTPTRSVTLQNTYADEFTVNKGWNGNANFAVLTNFNPGDGGTYNYVRNTASFGILMLDNDSASPKHEVSCCNAGFTQGIVCFAFDPLGRISANATITPTNTYAKYLFNSYSWFGVDRTGSTAAKSYINGVLHTTQSSASTAIENKAIAIMAGYNGAFAAGTYTSNSHAVFYAGAGLTPNDEMTAYNYAFGYGNITNITKRVTFEGDSRTGSVGFPALSNNCRYPKMVMSSLGSGWSGQVVSEANDTAQGIVTQYATEISPFRNTSLSKDIIVLWSGTNDIAGSRTASQIYADIVSFCTTAKNAGFTPIILGEIDRNWTSYAAMDAVRSSLRSLFLADFTASTSATNVFSGPSYASYYVDLWADTRLRTYADTNYFQADGIHPSSAGSDIVAAFATSALQLL